MRFSPNSGFLSLPAAILIVVFLICTATRLPGAIIPVALNQGTAAATFSQSDMSGNFEASKAVDGTVTSAWPHINGWAIHPAAGQRHAAVFETLANTDFRGFVTIVLIQDFLHGAEGFEGQENHQIGRFRLSFTTAHRSQFADGAASGGKIGRDAIWTPLDPERCQACFRDGGVAPETTMTRLADKSVLVSGKNHRGFYTITVPLRARGVTGFKLEVLPDPSLPCNGPGRDPVSGNFVLTEFQVFTAVVPEPVPFGIGPPPHSPEVPEPSTWITAALLLLPFLLAGRKWGKNL